jgi:hypothetical protein
LNIDSLKKSAPIIFDCTGSIEGCEESSVGDLNEQDGETQQQEEPRAKRQKVKHEELTLSPTSSVE